MHWFARIGRTAGALAFMLAGAGGVLWLVTTMNAGGPPPPEPATGEAPAIRLEAPQPRPRPERPAPPRPPRPAARDRALKAPPPELAASLSAVSLAIPGMAASDLDAAPAGLVDGADAARDLVMTEAAVDVPPRPLARQAPPYPPRARAKGLEGAVTLNLLVGANGEVLDVRVLDASPPGVFEDAAVATVRSWRFQPALYRGQQVKVWARQVLRFDLS
jgi:protein TonB